MQLVPPDRTQLTTLINLESIESGYRILCGQCFNAESAKLGAWTNLKHLNFEPVRIFDCEGQEHDFHFRTHLSLAVWR